MSNIYSSQNTFVYIWYDGKKFYLGVHKGTPDDGYICSSKVMMEEYKNRPQDFRRRILAYGTMKEMADLEKRLLQNIKEKGKWNKYYNITIAFPNQWLNGKTQHTPESIQKMKESHKKRHSKRTKEEKKLSAKKTSETLLAKNFKHTPETLELMSKNRSLAGNGTSWNKGISMKTYKKGTYSKRS